MSNADVSDAFRNVRIDPGEAHHLCYTIEKSVVIDFSLTFGRSGSPGFWDVMSAAAEYAHCNTTITTAQLLDEGMDMMAHVTIMDRWEEGKPTPVADDETIRAHRGGGIFDPFFATVYVDNYILMRVQHSEHDAAALIASAKLASDHVRLFGPGKSGITPILAPKIAKTGTPYSTPRVLPSTRTL